MRKLGRVFIVCIVAFPAILAGKPVYANHIPDELFLEVYQALMGPVCRNSDGNAGVSQDCDTPPPEVMDCWRDKLHMYYDEETLRAFLEEIKASNEKYPYYNQPYYNEFFSGRNWDNAMDFQMECGP